MSEQQQRRRVDKKMSDLRAVKRPGIYRDGGKQWRAGWTRACPRSDRGDGGVHGSGLPFPLAYFFNCQLTQPHRLTSNQILLGI